MRETRVSADDLRAAIERTGYYPGLVTDAVWSALGTEPVTAYVVQHDAIFDPGMEVRRHITVLALTPTRLIYSHTDEHPAEEPESHPQAETSTEAVRFSRVSSVAVTRVVPDPGAYVPGVTMPTEVVLTIGWNVLSHVELEPAHCGDENCEADHGYLGTITADDLALRVSEAADGEDGIRQVLAFAASLAGAGPIERRTHKAYRVTLVPIQHARHVAGTPRWVTGCCAKMSRVCRRSAGPDTDSRQRTAPV